MTTGATDGWLAPAEKLVKQFEGCAKRRPDGAFDAYPDVAKGWSVPTIGWGTTGADIKQGTIWTQAQCDARMLSDLMTIYGPEVDRLCAAVATTANQKAALVDFAYNEGATNLAESTLLRLHRDGKYRAAAAEFGRWVYSNHQKLPGLVSRRAAEAALYLGGN